MKSGGQKLFQPPKSSLPHCLHRCPSTIYLQDDNIKKTVQHPRSPPRHRSSLLAGSLHDDPAASLFSLVSPKTLLDTFTVVCESNQPGEVERRRQSLAVAEHHRRLWSLRTTSALWNWGETKAKGCMQYLWGGWR
nr:hypothetical protein Iba_chr14dCG2870 [Ipomoea batatas]